VSLRLLDRSDDREKAADTSDGGQAGHSVGGAVPAPVPSAGWAAEQPPPAPRVLVVDDTSRMRAELTALLEDAGFQVIGEASHGAEGVMLARELRPDVVLMDVRMPILDGIAATEYITRELPATRVIVFSAFEDRELEATARAAGARGFLVKGTTPAVIAAAVQDAARGG
jgi:DNA-binding NarL/FixJ family response regulator